MTKGRVVSGNLNTHRLRQNHPDDGGTVRFNELGVVLYRLTRMTVHLLLNLSEPSFQHTNSPRSNSRHHLELEGSRTLLFELPYVVEETECYWRGSVSS